MCRVNGVYRQLQGTVKQVREEKKGYSQAMEDCEIQFKPWVVAPFFFLIIDISV